MNRAAVVRRQPSPVRAQRASARATTAFVFSGGASLCAMQAGMLDALYERGIVADLLVATSLGAVNAAFVASRPQTPQTSHALARMWRTIGREDIFPVSLGALVGGVCGQRDDIVSDRALRRLVRRNVELADLADAPTPLHLLALLVTLTARRGSAWRCPTDGWPGRGLYLDPSPRRSDPSMLRPMLGRRFRAARTTTTAARANSTQRVPPVSPPVHAPQRPSPVAVVSASVHDTSRPSPAHAVSVAPAVAGAAAGRETLIRVQGVEKTFGSVAALRGVDLTVERGTVLGLLGRNGAGKSTLVRILSTLLAPDRGSASIAGVDVARDPHRVRSLIGLAGQAAAVDPILTGRENLELVGRLYGLPRREARARAADVLERLSLTAAGDRRVLTYSGGMRRRLDLGASLVGKPLVLIMDEPTTGLDPRTRLELWRFVDDLVREGTTVLLTTQYLEEADRLADRIAVLDRGTVIATGTASELKQRIGGDVLELRARSGVDVQRLRGLLAGLGAGEPVVDMRWQRLTLPTKDPIKTLLTASRHIQESGIKVDDLGLRRPSLDDVFLSLTGGGETGPPGATHNERPLPEQGRPPA